MRRRYEYEQIQKSKDPLTLSILHFDDNFEDVVSKNKWIKNNASSLYSCIFKEGKFGKGITSESRPYLNQYCSVYTESIDLKIYEEDYTVEFWIKPSTLASDNDCSVEFVAGAFDFYLTYSAENPSTMRLFVTTSTSGTGWDTMMDSQLQLKHLFHTVNKWYHFCIQIGRDSTEVYVDGSKKYVFNYGDKKLYSAPGYTKVTLEGGNFIMDEFRISMTKRYDINGFSVPTQPFD